MTVGTNVYVQFSGAAFDSQVLAGSQAVQLCILCGMSGLNCYPVQVNELGQLIQISGA